MDKSATVEECLYLISSVEYEVYNLPVVCLTYDFTSKTWNVYFGNTTKFKQPVIQEQTPLDACLKFIDFLKETKLL